ncbi:YceD family protein [Actibacterium sp. D379-3]
MTDAPQTTALRLAALPPGKPYAFALTPDAAARAAIAARLGLLALRKLSFRGQIVPEGRADWRLAARLGATVGQPCVVTLTPVTTRIDTDVIRRYLAEMPDQPEGDEVEMPEDDSAEPLPPLLDLNQVMEEALALNLPLYPRAEGAELGEAVFSAPGTAPMHDEDAKPLAGLAALRDRLRGDTPDGGEDGDENGGD